MKEIIKIDIPKGYEFAGIDDDNQQVIFEKIGYQYPKTYEECCKILKVTHCEWYGYLGEILVPFQKLLICRNAYWKIAGEQIGLGKPWKPDWNNPNRKYFISLPCGELGFYDLRVLVFPIEEMRGAFHENFKDLIEQCKELL